jgi:hypothetical protein
LLIRELMQARKALPFANQLPGNRVAQQPCLPMVVQHTDRSFKMSSLRRFHSIAALCGDGLRPELQELFKRPAVNPQTELFTRDDGMVQSGPDPVSAERGQGEASRSNAGGTTEVVFSRKFQLSN